MARRTYDIPDEQHGKLKRLAGLFCTTQAKFLAYLIDAEWQRSRIHHIDLKLEKTHEKTE